MEQPRRLISFSLYGTNQKYIRGAIENARLAPVIYPGWKMRVYCEDSTPTRDLERLGCQIVRKGISQGHLGMPWRFLATWEYGWEAVIVRDADSRLNVREAAAVQEWLASGMKVHTMQDHPHHSDYYPLFGGMWGVKGGTLPNLDYQLAYFLRMNGRKRLSDMIFLRAFIWKLVKDSTLRHSSVPTSYPSVPFPPHAPYDGFVGQQYEADNTPVWPKV